MKRNVPPRTFLGKVATFRGKIRYNSTIYSLRAYAFVANSICRGSYILFEKARLFPVLRIYGDFFDGR